jgi:hypothetical protein
VAEDHGVRVIEAHVNTLDVTALGFDKAITKETGRKPYHPASEALLVRRGGRQRTVAGDLLGIVPSASRLTAGRRTAW